MRAVILCAAAALLFAVISAQEPPSAQASVAEKIKSNLQKRWNETWAQGGLNGTAPPGCVFYFSSPASGELVMPLGNATLQGAPMQPDSQFLAASQSKIFTSTVVLKLAEQGRVGLNDSIAKYLPVVAADLSYPKAINGAPNGSSIQVQDLLRMTAGLHERPDPDGNTEFVPHDELWALYLETSGNNLLTGIPGKARAYSDEGAQLAAYIIQNVTGKSLKENTAHFITEPLGLNSTVEGGDVPFNKSAIAPNLTDAFLRNSDTVSGIIPFYDPSLDWGTASMISTAPDTGHFLQALFDGHGRLLSNATIARMTDFDEEFTEDDGDLKNPPFIEDGYGLGIQGFEVPELGPGIFWGHAGINPGFGSFALYGRETNITFALFLNNENMEPIRNLMLDAVVQVLNSTSVSS